MAIATGPAVAVPAVPAEIVASGGSLTVSPDARLPRLPPGTIVLYVMHTNAQVSALAESGVPGYEKNAVRFKNRFFEDYARIADLRDAKFDEGDSEAYAMTYGQASRFLLHLYANLAARRQAGKGVLGARLCFATHVVCVDSWFPTADTFKTLAAWGLLKGAGCAVPVLIHLARGPALVGGVDTRDYRNPIDLSWGARGSGKPVAQDAVGRAASDLLNHLRNLGADRAGARRNIGAAFGKIYLVIPDPRTRRSLHAEMETIVQQNDWSFDEGGGLQVVYVFWSEIHLTTFRGAEHVVVLPYTKNPRGYEAASARRIGWVLARLETLRNSARLPLRVVVLPGGVDEVATIDRVAGGTEHASDPWPDAIAHVKSLEPDDRYHLLCKLADSSGQLPQVFGDDVPGAESQGLVTAIGTTITGLTPTGVFAARGAMSPTTLRFVTNWRKTNKGAFPMVCIAAVIERALKNDTPLTGPNPDGHRDPLVHQLSVLVGYVKRHRLVTSNPNAINEHARATSASPEALTDLLVRISALRTSGVSGRLEYGPFDPASAVSVMHEYGMFPEAEYIDTSEAGEPRYMLPGKTGYYIPNGTHRAAQRILVIAARRSNVAWTMNDHPEFRLDLYAAV